MHRIRPPSVHPVLVAGDASGGLGLGELAFRVLGVGGAAVLYQVAARVMAVVVWGLAFGFAGRQLVAGGGDAVVGDGTAVLLAGAVAVGVVLLVLLAGGAVFAAQAAQFVAAEATVAGRGFVVAVGADVAVGIVVVSDDKTATSKPQINATISVRIGIASGIIRSYHRVLALKCWAREACAHRAFKRDFSLELTRLTSLHGLIPENNACYCSR
ncbi:MAG: hypothetical protein NTV43_13855 [Methylococcales bacterium]|nr:hypothetical protein [Methylococcales bacterium]